MTNLTFSRLTADGSQLVLLDAAGGEFRVAVTDRLRQTIHPGQSDPALQMRIPVDGPVTPRDVQRKIRHGASVTEVVAESGMSKEKVENFAVPVFQERAFVAQQALTCLVPAGGTPSETPSPRSCVRAVSTRTRSGTLAPTRRLLDRRGAFRQRQGDGAHERRAGEFLYDPSSRSVVAENDTARWLTNATEIAEPEPDRVIVIDADEDVAVAHWDNLHPSVRGQRSEIDNRLGRGCRLRTGPVTRRRASSGQAGDHPRRRAAAVAPRRSSSGCAQAGRTPRADLGRDPLRRHQNDEPEE